MLFHFLTTSKNANILGNLFKYACSQHKKCQKKSINLQETFIKRGSLWLFYQFWATVGLFRFCLVGRKYAQTPNAECQTLLLSLFAPFLLLSLLVLTCSDAKLMYASAVKAICSLTPRQTEPLSKAYSLTRLHLLLFFFFGETGAS